MKKHVHEAKIKAARTKVRKKFNHLESWINTGEPPHPFVAAAYDIPNTIEEAIDEARALSNKIWKPSNLELEMMAIAKRQEAMRRARESGGQGEGQS